MATSASLLAQVEAAIEALLTGGASSYSIGSRSVTKLDLGELMRQRDLLRMAVDRENGSAFRLGRITRPSR